MKNRLLIALAAILALSATALAGTPTRWDGIKRTGNKVEYETYNESMGAAAHIMAISGIGIRSVTEIGVTFAAAETCTVTILLTPSGTGPIKKLEVTGTATTFTFVVGNEAGLVMGSTFTVTFDTTSASTYQAFVTTKRL